MAQTPWPWRYFKPWEMACRETGQCAMDPAFMDRLDRLREAFGRPMVVSSGFRSPTHTKELGKEVAGVHAEGVAVDVVVSGAAAYRLVQLAMEMGFTGIGVSQKGDRARRFVHLDMAKSTADHPRPWIWSY